MIDMETSVGSGFSPSAQPYIERGVCTTVDNLPYFIADILLFLVSCAGIYSSVRTGRLYEGGKGVDPTGRVFQLTAIALSLIAAVTLFDLAVRILYGAVEFPFVRLAIGVSIGVIVVGQLMLARWAGGRDATAEV